MGNCLCRRSNAVVPYSEVSTPQSVQAQSHKGSKSPTSSLGNWPSLQQLYLTCSSLQPARLQDDASQLATHTAACLHTLTSGGTHPPSSIVAAVLSECCQCMDRLLQPVHQGTETLLADSWDSLTAAQFLSALSKAAHKSYPGHADALRWLGDALSPVADLLHTVHTSRQASHMIQSSTTGMPGYAESWSSASSQGTAFTSLSATGLKVPAMDSIVAMLGVIFYRRVILEPQATLTARSKAVLSLTAALGWNTGQLAICCSPEQRGMLLAVHVPSALNMGERRVRVTVRRSCAFWDAFRDVQRQQIELSADGVPGAPCKLFPAYVDELLEPISSEASSSLRPARGVPVVEAGEGHGPRKEFFVLAALDAAGCQTQPSRPGSGDHSRGSCTAAAPVLLVYNRSAGAYWLNQSLAKTEELVAAYEFLGWLFAQSLLNRAPLGIPVAPLLVEMLMHGDSFTPTMQHLLDYDPAAAKSVHNAVSLPPSQYRAMLELEGLPSAMTADQYVEHAVRGLLMVNVRWQVQAMAAGIRHVLDPGMCSLWCLGPEELAACITGEEAQQDIQDLRKVFRVVLDDEFAPEGEGEETVRILWDLIAEWPREKRLKLVEFITGTPRLPLPGSELLKIECPFVALSMAERAEMIQKLPQAHTCDNLLELPNYWASLLEVRRHTSGFRELAEHDLEGLRKECRDILEERLTLAMTACMGYGLDQRG